MIGFIGRNLTDDQIYYNKRLQKVRNVIERCIGVLKMRFRCILGERKLRYHPTKASQIVMACATLHNFLMYRKYDIRRDINENDLENVIDARNQAQVNRVNANANRIGNVVRNELKDVLLLQRA